ncbi:MAG TPA: hypothetical protein ENI48_05145 [Thioploca sp.]|nr:MAG: hypothetical protein B6247_31670 [Beggiatoa sp. 4572_84]HEC84612.1 hypothetical protein [Thioploca sp.]
MDKTLNQALQAKVPKKPTTPSTRHHLPEFPDEYTPAQWIWPPFAGRCILDKIFKYALRARLQPDGTWIIKAKNDWRCYSKSHWLYESEEAAREALRANMRMHLQCSPILSEQRCVVVAFPINNTWRLWQIVHVEPTLAEDLAKALQEEQPDKLALETFRGATRHADALQQSTRYPPLLNLTLENLGIDAERQLVYLGCVDEETNAIQPTTEEALVETIKPAFTAPIAQALPNIDVAAVVKEFEKMDGFEQQYLVDMLTQLVKNFANR